MDKRGYNTQNWQARSLQMQAHMGLERGPWRLAFPEWLSNIGDIAGFQMGLELNPNTNEIQSIFETPTNGTTSLGPIF